MKRLSTLIIIIVIAISLGAQTELTEFQKFKENEQRAFQQYHNQQDSLFIQYKKEIEDKWNEFRESTKKEWVSYSAEFEGRSIVNFETGKIEVKAIVEKDNPQAELIAKKKLLEQLKTILQEKDETNKPILAEQIKTPDSSKKITKKNINKIVEKIVKKSKKAEIKGKDNKERVVVSVSLDMVPNHVKIRAEKFRGIIEKKCKRFNVEPALVLAIIHTESYFNPKAYNRHGNAYGMMQIVPKYAGLTMNNVLYKKNKQPSSKQLFNADTNIEMGVGYIKWLAENKWKKVTNKTNQQYCIICSYNGGPGTIYKAMTGKMKKIGTKKWNKMFVDLSNMNSDKLYNKLRKDVPWAETRKYIKLVREKMENVYKNI
ncbi:MAG: murein transglycosylase domain-containing protein [Candidatus Cloacimonetes bacterium]|nr:murein transglycosylase domain-containing protein [Candidatus Cloacimonadota bacterium]